jgi:hypothetical protein
MTDALEDKTLWTESRLQDEVSQLLPSGCSLVTVMEDSTWVLRLVQEVLVSGNLRENVLWEVEHFDKRQALFEAYGRLWLGPHPSSGTWSPTKPRPTPETVTRFVVSPEPDPEDLDPSEIASVYERGSS